jgi:5-hydroxyisourate hydrolase-like protein (transthyretin family)
VSGDAQYTRKGTTLEEPVVVRVTDDQGKPAHNVTVHFQVVEGGGSLSRTSAATNNEGRTSVNWTMGSNTGLNRMHITVADNSALGATATATSAEYYCVEEDPTFSATFAPAHNLMMLTRASSLTAGSAGLVRYAINSGGAQVSVAASLVKTYPDGGFQKAIADCVFAANGDLFIAWYDYPPQIMRVATNGDITHFATLESAPIDGTQGTELAMTPNGALMGCDARGPFYVTCRDTLSRYPGAIYTGSDLNRDAANSDALACDPTSGTLYYIYKQDRRLKRIPINGVTASGPVENVMTTALDIDVSDGARGMVVDGSDGSIYILVETAATKSIVKVTSSGTLTTVKDFFSRGAGDAAGIQDDLAIDRSLKYLYTLDTKNNVFLAFGLPTSADPGSLITIVPANGANDISDAGSREPVGLDVIPSGAP